MLAAARIGNMRIFISLVLLTIVVSSASAEEWASRHGSCYEWEGRWDMQQEPSGVWVGVIDLVHVGGPCVPENKQHHTNEVRAVIVGADFFARRTTGAAMCYLHGVVRSHEVRGWELCVSGSAPLAFAVRLSPPSGEQNEPPRR